MNATIKVTRVCIILSICLSALYSFCQTPFYQNYKPKEYVGATQNWAIAQDDKGIMYFGNNEGVLQYDGVSWRNINAPSIVRSIAISDDQTIYVGIVNDFGKLASDDQGNLHFRSIKADYPDLDLENKDVWRTWAIGDEIFFCAFEKIMRLKNGDITIFKPQEEFTFSFKVRNELYVHSRGKGLMKYNGSDGFELLKGTELFASTRIYTLLPFESDKLMVGTRNSGISIYSLAEEKILRSYSPRFRKVSDFLKREKVYCGAASSNGKFVAGTINGGIVEFDSNGLIHMIYDKNNGLQSDAIFYLKYDGFGHLWAALAKGIASVNTILPFMKYSEKDGIDGNILAMEQCENSIYIGTGQMLYQFGKDKKIKKINESVGQSWFIKEAQEELLVSHNPKGFSQIMPNGLQTIRGGEDLVGSNISEISKNSKYLLAGALEGFFILEKINNQWKVKNRVEGLDEGVYSFEIDKDGIIWARCSPGELYELEMNDDLKKFNKKIKRNSLDSSEDDRGTLYPYKTNSGEVIFGSDNGVFEYDEANDLFVRFGPMKQLEGEVNPIKEDSHGNFWYEESKNGKHYKGVLTHENGEWKNEIKPFLKFSDTEIYKGSSNAILENDEGKILFGTTEGLIIYDPEIRNDEKSNFHTTIRKVYIKDSLIFEGHKSPNSLLPPIHFSYADLKFEYACHYFEDGEQNIYSTRLIGRDTTWSEWSHNSQKEYTNLIEGDYTFEVKAKNVYNQVSTIGSFDFTIQPPWYRSNLAFVGYLLALALLIRAATWANSSILRARNEELERMVKVRTSELRIEKEKSENLSENLLRVFSIIGHDLRKPAISFRGITSKINFFLGEKDFESLEKLGDSIEHDAHSLMSLTDNLLNWALRQKDAIPHKPQIIKLNELTHSVIDTFKSFASKKDILIKVNIADHHVAYADVNALQLIMRNLLDNGLKFTQEGGRIDISTTQNNTHTELIVCDNGIGMTPDQIKVLFTLKKDKNRAGTKGEKGTGLGLHLVKEMIEINNGLIKVESKIGTGTKFVIQFPNRSVTHV